LMDYGLAISNAICLALIDRPPCRHGAQFL
jgi:hypothetical protein